MADEIPASDPGLPEGQGSSDLAAGFLVGGGRFSLLREVARGGMGVVWLAHDERLVAPVALKFLSEMVRTNPAALSDLRQETQKSRMLSHPNIIRIYDLYEAPDEAAFISMEYVDGPNMWTLRTRQPQGFFTWDYLKPIAKQMCEALDYAHSENVVHRDLKPGNMLLDDRQRLRLADFGIAARAFENIAADARHRSSGTVSYMSPQQIDGLPPRVTDDIYALGATLYELLSGHPPFYQNDIAYQVRNVLPTPLTERLADLEVDNEIPPSVIALIMACLAKDPDKRPQMAGAVADWIRLADSTPASPAPMASAVFSAPVVSPLPETKKAILPPATIGETESETESGSDPPPTPEENSIGRRIGMTAGAVGLGLLTWLAWGHFIPKMPEVAAPVPQTNAPKAPVNDTPPAVVVAPPANASSVSVELGDVNREKGLRQLVAPEGAGAAPSHIGGKECRHLTLDRRPRARVFFQILPAYKRPGPVGARIQVEYYAAMTGEMNIMLGKAPHYVNAGKKDFNGDRVWKTAYFQVDDAAFHNGLRGGADFSLVTTCPELYIHSVAVFFEQ